MLFRIITLIRRWIRMPKPKSPVRVGWAEAVRKIAAAGDDAQVLPEFSNSFDDEWIW
jgi:antitoxin MazE